MLSQAVGSKPLVLSYLPHYKKVPVLSGKETLVAPFPPSWAQAALKKEAMRTERLRESCSNGLQNDEEEVVLEVV